ncbi:MAG: NAD(P)-dependent oxidoreductase [Burkholderiaceae bacterium]
MNATPPLADIGVPKERLPGERRVLMLPATVSEFRKAGFRVLVEYGAGEGIGISDQRYVEAGADLSSVDRVWACDAVFKYKAPSRAEFGYFRTGLVLAGILHAEGDHDLTEALLRAGMTAYSYEFFSDAPGKFPLAAAGGQIAGRMAALQAVQLLQSQFGGMGKLPGVQDDELGRVTCVVIGSGNVGASAAETLCALGCQVTVLASSEHSRVSARRRFALSAPSLEVLVNNAETLRSRVAVSDIVIGAILISTFDTPAMVTQEMVRSMRAGSVLIDATAGYGGGYMPTFTTNTSLHSPRFVSDGVVHCKIDNFPAAVPMTAVQTVNRLYPPYLIALARSLFHGVEDPVSAAGLMVRGGKVLHPELARHWTHNASSMPC